MISRKFKEKKRRGERERERKRESERQKEKKRPMSGRALLIIPRKNKFQISFVH